MTQNIVGCVIDLRVRGDFVKTFLEQVRNELMRELNPSSDGVFNQVWYKYIGYE